MTRFRWSDTHEPVEGRAIAADETLERLAGMLNELALEGNAMSVGEVDGFVSGLVVCPELVPHSEWLAHVWEPDTEFDNSQKAEATAVALIDHYNRVARTLEDEPEHYGPTLEVDEGLEETFWKEWMVGFVRAMRLRPGAWEPIEGSDELDVIETVEAIHALCAVANGTSRLSEEGIEVLESMAPMLIGGVVRDLNARKQSRGVSAGERIVSDLTAAFGVARPRETPCRCGSGRLYDRCCGAH